MVLHHQYLDNKIQSTKEFFMKKNILLIICSISLLYFILNFNNIDVAKFDIFKVETFLS